MNVVQFPPEHMGAPRGLAVQVSRYPQEDGRDLFCIELLHPDGTWDHLSHAWAREEAQKAAGDVAEEKGAQLLAVSLWPGRSALA